VAKWVIGSLMKPEEYFKTISDIGKKYETFEMEDRLEFQLQAVM
jgi:hypothetical protein